MERGETRKKERSEHMERTSGNMERTSGKKTYERPKVLAVGESLAHQGICGRYHSCGDLVKRD